VWQWPNRARLPQPLVTLDRCALFPGCDRLRSASFPPTGHGLVVTASFDRTAVVWNADTGRIETVLDGNASTVTSAHFSDGARYVLTASSDGTARLWDTQTGVQLEEYDHPARLTRAIFGPHDHWIATTSADGAVRIWPVAPPTDDTGALRRQALLRLGQLGVKPLSPVQRTVLLPSS
jgi:WD40 repeat protein